MTVVLFALTYAPCSDLDVCFSCGIPGRSSEKSISEDSSPHLDASVTVVSDSVDNIPFRSSARSVLLFAFHTDTLANEGFFPISFGTSFGSLSPSFFGLLTFKIANRVFAAVLCLGIRACVDATRGPCSFWV
jgi:hypothetical protein